MVLGQQMIFISDKMENAVDYTGNPDVATTNAGSNLALGSEDTMHLVNVLSQLVVI